MPANESRDYHRLQQLLDAHHPCILIVTYEEAEALDLIGRATEREKRPVWIWSVLRGVCELHRPEALAVKDTEHPAAALYHLAYNETGSIAVMLDVIEHLREPRTLRALRDAIGRFRGGAGTLILIDHRDDLPAAVAHQATPLELSLPDETEIEQITVDALRSVHRKNPIRVELTRSEMKTIVRNLRGLTARQIEQIVSDIVAEDRRFDADDINKVLAAKRRMLQRGELLQYVETPTDLSEIGGLNRLKRWLGQRQNALTDRAAAFGISPPRGVLMLGVQGAGKSLCAKAIATAWHRPLLRLDVGNLYNSYIGESERRLREALKQAEIMSPNILWIDEIEKAFASAASRNTDGGLSRRMFGTLLTWMQEHDAPVFLVATANDIEALPPELLRKGRFDEIFFVDLPTEPVRREIFAIHLRKRNRDPDTFDLDRLAEASDRFSGAEIEQAVVSALHNAFDRDERLATGHLLSAIDASPPLAVTMAERVEDLRDWAGGRCVPAD